MWGAKADPVATLVVTLLLKLLRMLMLVLIERCQCAACGATQPQTGRGASTPVHC